MAAATAALALAAAAAAAAAVGLTQLAVEFRLEASWAPVESRDSSPRSGSSADGGEGDLRGDEACGRACAMLTACAASERCGGIKLVLGGPGTAGAAVPLSTCGEACGTALSQEAGGDLRAAGLLSLRFGDLVDSTWQPRPTLLVSTMQFGGGLFSERRLFSSALGQVPSAESLWRGLEANAPPAG